MKKKRSRKPGGRQNVRPLGLNLILWFTFLLFAVLLIALFTVVQNYQTNRQYRERMEENLREAGGTLKAELGSSEVHASDVSRLMLSAANEYGVSAYLFSAEGEPVYPDKTVGGDYSDIVRMVREQFSAMDEENRRQNAQAFITSPDSMGYATIVNVWGNEHYLYLSGSFDLLNRMMTDLRWFSLITGLFAIALSFVVSGFVSMVIAKPVTELTERAKELARGNYGVGFSGAYFCTEVNELSKAFEHARAEISKTDAMQKELIANVSHDFKTPLTMIKAYAAMIGEISGDDPEKRAKHTQIIMDEADRLAALVGDLLDLSRLQAGIDNSEPTVFNLSEQVFRVASRFDYLTETQGYTLVYDVDEDLYAFAGKERVEQVLYNLIGNAFNYTGADKRVTVRLKKSASGARFEVIDTGKGIPPEEIDTIWERYYRSSETHKRPVQGTGLGLSIVKNLLLRYKIPFGVQSEVGKGSCFWVDFPAPPEDARGTAAPPEGGGKGEDPQKP